MAIKSAQCRHSLQRSIMHCYILLPVEIRTADHSTKTSAKPFQPPQQTRSGVQTGYGIRHPCLSERRRVFCNTISVTSQEANNASPQQLFLDSLAQNLICSRAKLRAEFVHHTALIRRWGCSSAGRARRSQRRGQGFDPPHLHHQNIGVFFLPLFRSNHNPFKLGPNI